MQTHPERFKTNVREALDDSKLRVAIRRTTDKAEAKRAEAIGRFRGFDSARQQGQTIKDHVIQNLDFYLQEFERNATQSGAIVHWASTAEQASDIVLGICRKQGAINVTRAKSMLGEEIGLADALDRAGMNRTETDLAEHVIQLAGDPPSHIVWPSMHRTREDVIELFKSHHKNPVASDSVEGLVRSARAELREKFLAADIGITGANFLLANSGTVCTVTNEGNAELTTTPPRVHIVTAGIEKLVPSMQHAMPLLRLLVRSATGGEITQYTTFYNGPKRAGDADGPDEFHIVLVDNGRTKMLRENLSEMLRCIRCGACMNHCVVYKHIGGHAYGSVYPGPMGSVLTPVFDGLKRSINLPHACTLNGRCASVCPVNIPLPKLLRSHRARSWNRRYEPMFNRLAVGAFVLLARYPGLFQFASRMGVATMRLFSKNGRIRFMPMARGWTQNRDLPEPGQTTFMNQYRRQGID